MCRRFALRGHRHDNWLRYAPPWKRASRYNIAPSEAVLCLTAIENGLYPKFRSLRWGYPLTGAADRRGYVITVNACTMLRRAWSRDMLRTRRCLIPADGFYAWDGGQRRGAAQPHFIHQPDDHPFYFAGLWAEQDDIRYCFILTTHTPACTAALPPRMPVILHANYHEPWLDARNRDAYDLDSMLTRGLPPALESHPVGPYVNRPGSEGPACVQRVGPARRNTARAAPHTPDRRRVRHL